MSNSQIDLRIRKTKKAIKYALAELIEEIGFRAITVKSLTNKAGINRGTFYLHYDNIDDLISEYYDDIIKGLYDLFEEYSSNKLTNTITVTINDGRKITSFNIVLLQFIKENRVLFGSLLLTWRNRPDREKIKHFVENILFYHENALIQTDNLPVPRKYYAAYIFSSFMGVIVKWLEGDCEESVEDMSSILATLNFHGVTPPFK